MAGEVLNIKVCLTLKLRSGLASLSSHRSVDWKVPRNLPLLTQFTVRCNPFNKDFRSPTMKYILAILLFSTTILNVYSQSVIATTKDPLATANHNQRKVIRDSNENIYIVYSDSIANSLSIKGLYYNKIGDKWTEPVIICEGKNPSLAISIQDKLYLLYQSIDTLSQIKMKYSDDFSTWSDCKTLSDTLFRSYLPVADTDSDGILNVMWIQENKNGTNSAIYAKVQNGEHLVSSVITTKDEINDIAIANSLNYQNNTFYFAYHYSKDSIVFCSTQDYMRSIDSVQKTTGSQPGITYNQVSVNYTGKNGIFRLLYLDDNNNLIEQELDEGEECCTTDEIINGSKIDYICVDDLMPPIGYSYLFIRNDSLFHGFSHGKSWPRMILDTISTKPLYPSIAYKKFNVEYIDFIWMESAGSEYNIHYKRDDKYQYIYPHVNNVPFTGVKITGYPNPFTDFLNIVIETDQGKPWPSIDIFDTKSRLVKSLSPEKSNKNNFTFRWSVSEDYNVPQGLYFIRCTIGNQRITKKVIKVN